MSTIDHIFAFTSKGAVQKVFTALGFLDKEGNPVPGVEISSTPVPITRAPATYDRDGEELTPAVMDPRYLVSVRLHHEKAADELRGKAQEDGDGKRLSAFDRTKLGAQFKKGTERTDYVKSRRLTFDTATVELMDPDNWPGGPPRVWQ